MWTIYYHQNKTNGKIYVGITSTKPELRWGKNGSRYKHSPHFEAALNKYGWDGFEHEIYASGLTKEEAENMERVLIQKFQLQNPEYGYNIEDGGSVKTGVYHDPKVNREAAKDIFKPVQCIEDGQCFECIKDAAVFYGLSRSAVRRSAQRYDLDSHHNYSHSGKHFKFISHIKA